MINRQSIARAYQSTLRHPRSAFFKDDSSRPASLPGMADTPYLGWVGRQFGGTVLIAKNPGGGGDAEQETKPADLRVQRALLALRDAPPEASGEMLDQLTAAYHAQLPTIGMGRLLDDVVNALNEDVEQIAFFNVCPYRTRQNKTPTQVMRRSCELVVGPLLEALNPDTIIFLGVSWSEAMAEDYRARWTHRLPRAINDKQLKAEAKPVLERIKQDNAARAAFRSKTLPH